MQRQDDCIIIRGNPPLPKHAEDCDENDYYKRMKLVHTGSLSNYTVFVIYYYSISEILYSLLLGECGRSYRLSAKIFSIRRHEGFAKSTRGAERPKEGSHVERGNQKL